MRKILGYPKNILPPSHQFGMVKCTSMIKFVLRMSLQIFVNIL